MSVRRFMTPRSLGILTGVVLASCATAAAAQPATSLGVAAARHRDENGGALETAKGPVALALTYTSDANANVSGGVERGADYLQRVGLIGDLDLDRAIGWRGAAVHVSVHAISGEGLSGHRAGNLLTVSGLEAEPAVRLFNLWVEQKLPTGGSLRIGQFTAAQEFAVSPTASSFINATFGWPASFAADQISGGPSYPLAAPGARLSQPLGKRTSLMLAAFAGDPAGPGEGDPQRRDRSGLQGWRFARGAFLIGEAKRSIGNAAAVNLGGWYQTANAPLLDPAPDTQGKRGNWGVYAMADVTLTRRHGAAGPVLNGFIRASYSPPDRNAVDLYLDGGLTITGLLRSRPQDVLGVALAVAHFSGDLPGRAPSADPSIHVPTREVAFELNYQAKLRPNIIVQPNVQLILDPAYALASDSEAAMPLPRHALAIGLRTYIKLSRL